MTAQVVPRAQRPSRSIVDARRIAPLSHAEAGALASVELGRFLGLVETLGSEDWSRPTMCVDWSVRDIVAHQAGAYASGASFREFCRQWSQKSLPGREKIDAVNAFQLRERAGRSPAELLAELRDVGPRAIAARRRLSPLIRALRIPIPPLGLRPVSYLTDDLYLRDTWSHRVDICAATGQPLELTPGHDGRFTALIARDLDTRLAGQLGGRSVVYDLAGPAGGCFRIGRDSAPSATIELDAIDFHLLASERLAPDRVGCRIVGDEALALLALRQTRVLY